MRILLDNNVPRLLTSNLPDHQADTAFQRDWHTLTNGELLDQAESDGYQLLITADQRIPFAYTTGSALTQLAEDEEASRALRDLLLPKPETRSRQPCILSGKSFSERSRNMNETELAEILRRMYRNAPRGEQSTALHLFGIHYVADLSEPHISINQMVEQSGIGNSYSTEVRKGMRLAKYVELNESAAAHGL